MKFMDNDKFGWIILAVAALMMFAQMVRFLVKWLF